MPLFFGIHIQDLKSHLLSYGGLARHSYRQGESREPRYSFRGRTPNTSTTTSGYLIRRRIYVIAPLSGYQTMSLLASVKDMFGSPATESAGTKESKGAFWCNDCSERILDVDVPGAEPPDCPSCGNTMKFERTPDSGACAC